MVLQRIYYVLVCVLVMLQQPGLLTSSSSFSLAYSMPVSSVAARNNALPLALNSMRGSEKPVSSRPELDFSLSLHHALILRGGNRCHWLQTSLSAVSPLQQDFLLTTAVVGETMIWLKLWTWIAKKGLLSSLITRKIIHSFSAPLFLLHWPFFHAGNPRAALVASVIPLLQIIK